MYDSPDFPADYANAPAPAAPPPHILQQHRNFPLVPDALNLLVGIPGVGKTNLALDLAARAALARPFPPAPADILLHPSHANACPAFFLPGEIIFASSEYRNLLERSDALGIPRERICLPRPTEFSLTPYSKRNPRPIRRRDSRDDDPPPASAPFIDFFNYLPTRLHNPRLIVIDPLHVFINTDSGPSAIRDALLPLTDFARKTFITVLAITHLSKARGTFKNPRDILNHIPGCPAFGSAAQSILFLTYDPRSPQRRLLFHIKGNSGALASPMAFTFKTRPLLSDLVPLYPPPPILQWEQDPIINHPFVSAESSPGIDPIQKSQLELACDFLTHTLKDGPQPSNWVIKQARSLAISPRTLIRARLHLQIPCMLDTQHNQWVMSSPKTIPDNPLVQQDSP